MVHSHTLAIGALAILLSTPSLHGQDRARYRDYPLGASLASISALAGIPASEARTLHSRPALLQEIQWQRPYTASDAASVDPVKTIVFGFYDDQLATMVVDYDRDRTAGLTDVDLIDAISTTYGSQVKPAVRTGRGAASQAEQESGTPIARWEGAEYSVVMYRMSYASAVRVIVSSPRLAALARTAQAQAARLDDREAPQREIARQKKETDAARTAQEKARVANKAAFRP
jgi:hypothetical protein